MNKIAIYGGGIVAMLLAIVFKQKSYEVELWRPKQKRTNQNANQRVFALNAKSIEFLKDLGCFNTQNALSQTTLVQEMLIWDGITASQISFKASDIGKSNLSRIVDESFLWDSVFQVLEYHNIPIIDLAENEVCQPQGKDWYCTQSRASFLCIADGARSQIRKELNIPCKRYAYDQTAIVAKIRVHEFVSETAFQVFGPYGPLALLPLKEEGYYSIVWSLDSEQAKKILLCSDLELKQSLGQYLGGHLGDIIEIEGIQSYPLHMLHVHQYFGLNWLIAGDAAHHFHPLAGLGLNMGISDVRVLSDILTLNKLNKMSLGQYQRNRKANLTPVILGMNFLKNCFGIQNPLWVKCRSFGLDFLEQQNMFKKIMMYIMQEL